VQPAVVAHRGASAHAAEHTLAAYDLAIAQGADALECDVRLTRDGHLVCVHDRRVNRTTNAKGAVSTLSLAELSLLDYGGEIGVLTLDALLGLAADHGVPLFVETKHPVRYGGQVEARLVELLARRGLAQPSTKDGSPVVVMSFSTLAVRRVRALAPRLPTVLLLTQLWPTLRDGTLPPWADHTGPSVAMLRRDPEYVARAAEHGHATYTWTADDPADVELCAGIGVRWLATNAPAATRATLAR
jgi:glycerophosphoryl diester phosphodiesterase